MHVRHIQGISGSRERQDGPAVVAPAGNAPDGAVPERCRRAAGAQSGLLFGCFRGMPDWSLALGLTWEEESEGEG